MSEARVTGVKRGLPKLIGPGLLVAATGVGAGDLATGALAGARLGPAVLWAVLVGAAIKYLLNEGLARWQLATDMTVLEGTRRHLGRVPVLIFFVFLCFWSFFVGAALMSACGIAAAALVPLTGDLVRDKQIYGIVHSGLAVLLVFQGGFRLFEKAMRLCIGVMFLTVLFAAIAVRPDWGAVVSGLLWPAIPDLNTEGLRWTVGLIGGVGGTVTVLCYGYWIREENRTGLEELRTCRIDLLTGYCVTAVFGLCMVILGSRITVSSGGGNATLIVSLGESLKAAIGNAAGRPVQIAFLLGAWGAIASSMLGVWQSVPYLFVDCLQLLRQVGSPEKKQNSSVRPEQQPIYRQSLIAIATVPAVGLFQKFDLVQLAYAVVGAAFLPLLAAVLLLLNSRVRTIGTAARNSQVTTTLLILVLVFFAWAGFYDIRERIRKTTEPKKVSAVPVSCFPQSKTSTGVS